MITYIQTHRVQFFLSIAAVALSAVFILALFKLNHVSNTENEQEKNPVITSLPKNFDECVVAGGRERPGTFGTICSIGATSNSNAVLFDQCMKAGGGEFIIEGGLCDNGTYGCGGGRGCEMIYTKDGPPCTGNWCD